jgi:hypothetical protein
MNFRQWLLATAFAFLPGSSGAAQSATSTPVALDHGVSINLPPAWAQLSREQIATLPPGLAFAANLYDSSGNTRALMNVRFLPEMDFEQWEVEAMGEEGVAEFDAAFEEGIRSATTYRVTEWSGTRLESINGISALLSSYTRVVNGETRPSVVRLLRVFDGGRSFSLTVSARADDGDAVAQGSSILESLQSPQRAPQRAPTTPAEVVGLTPGWIFMNLVLTWSLGLMPPLLLRFLIFRRPLGKWPAGSIVALLWVGNLLFFTALGSQSRTHGALVLVAIAAFFILSGGIDASESSDEAPEGPSG